MEVVKTRIVGSLSRIKSKGLFFTGQLNYKRLKESKILKVY